MDEFSTIPINYKGLTWGPVRSISPKVSRKGGKVSMKAEEIERLIKEALPDAQVNISDLAGDGDHYSALVISRQFEGKTRVQQHQLVYDALQGRMGNELHALALQTSAPKAL